MNKNNLQLDCHQRIFSNKILFIISTLNTGGAQRAFSNIIMSLPENWEIDILLNDTTSIVYPYRGTLIDLGMKPQANKEKILYQAKVFIKRVITLKKLKKENNYIACVSALESANIANIISGNKYCKTIISVRAHLSSTQNKIPLKRFVDSLIRLLYSHSNRIVAVSQGIAEDLHVHYSIPSEKIVTIYNGYRASLIRSSAVERYSIPGISLKADNLLVTSGRLVNQKGQWHLLRALSLIKKSIPDIKLIILGEGPLRNDFERIVSEYHLEENVYMPGFVENPFPIYLNSKIFVFPSLFEGYPNAMAEAIICGLPCISTDCKTGPREILAPGTREPLSWNSTYEKAEYGILCPPFHDDKINNGTSLSEEETIFASAIIDMLHNPAMYEQYKQKSKEKASQLDMHEIIKQWLTVIES